MDELIYIQESLRKDRLESALLHSALNFSEERPYRAFHTLRWRFFLGLLPLDVNIESYDKTWIARTRQSEAEWLAISEGLKQRCQTITATTTTADTNQQQKRGRFGDSDSDEDLEEGDVLENPLLPTKGGCYAFRFHVEQIQKTIKNDLERLHWNLSVFEDPIVCDNILNILTNYCVRHDCEYKQGMHEIAAFIFYLTHRDASFIEELEKQKVNSQSSLLETFGIICSPSNVTALSFELFETIMGSNGLNLASWYYASADHAGNDIVSASQLVQGSYLAHLDPSLHHQMNTVYEIEGSSYLIRWLRLLFLREFSFTQCADIWGVFFSERFLVKGSDFRLVESTVTSLAASMLLFLKRELMIGRIEALLRVMKYPPVEDISGLIEKTMEQVGSKKNDIVRYFTPPSYENLRFEIHEETKTETEHSERNVAPESSSENKRMISQGVILSSIIKSLEEQWFPSSPLSSEEKDHITQNYVNAIAELKRVRDVLMCHIVDGS